MKKKRLLKRIGVFTALSCMFASCFANAPVTQVCAAEIEATNMDVSIGDAVCFDVTKEDIVTTEETSPVAEVSDIGMENSELLGASNGYNISYAYQVLSLVNQQRTANGLPALKMDKDLFETAQLRAEEIARKFSHTRPDGTSCSTAFPSGHFYLGENIAAGYGSPASVMSGWMDSIGHRNNILNTHFGAIGIGCYCYNGRYYWTQCFGSTLYNELTQAQANGTAVDTRPPSSAPVASNQSSNVTVNYSTHVQNIGWQDEVRDGATSGTMGKALRLEGIKISVVGDPNVGIEYQTHVQNIGWQGWKANGVVSGTQGRSLRLEGIAIRLTGSNKDKYDVYYRVHAQNYGWLDWAKNGHYAGTSGQSLRLEAIQIIVCDKGVWPNNGSQGCAYVEIGKGAKNADNAGMVNYMTHVQNYGDQKYVFDGSIAGTTGEALRLEAIRIKLNNSLTGVSGGVRYTTHIQNIGWQNSETNPNTWCKDGEMSGTSGKALRLEGIRIALYGDMANKYDIYYRVHAQNFGWMAWAKNGSPAGSAGYAYRLEGIQVVVVPKNSPAPNSNLCQQSRAFISR